MKAASNRDAQDLVQARDRRKGTPLLKYVDDLYDEFYAGRNDHRRLDYVRRMGAWAREHGKMMGIQANPRCLRNCPFHQFHNNLHGHNRMGQSAARERNDTAAGMTTEFVRFFKG